MTKVRERSDMGTRSSEFRIGFLVHDVSRLRQILFDQAMKPHGVTRAQWWTLAQLSRSGGEGMAQAELARHLGLGKVAVGSMIDRLEGGGLVERRVDAEDRRINRIHVTPRGHAMLDRMVAVGRRLNRTILDGLPAQDLAVADQVLTRIRRNLRAALDDKG
jgi:MarR family transcriptional regulator, transcriptional regulator for hemolysin